MFRISNQKLSQTRELIAGLIGDFDTLLTDVRQIRRLTFSRDGSEGEPAYVQRICQQRETLVTVAAMLADMRMEWSQAPEVVCDGHCEDGESAG